MLYFHQHGNATILCYHMISAADYQSTLTLSWLNFIIKLPNCNQQFNFRTKNVKNYPVLGFKLMTYWTRVSANPQYVDPAPAHSKNFVLLIPSDLNSGRYLPRTILSHCTTAAASNIILRNWERLIGLKVGREQTFLRHKTINPSCCVTKKDS